MIREPGLGYQRVMLAIGLVRNVDWKNWSKSPAQYRLTVHHDERRDETKATSENNIETPRPKRGAVEFQEMVAISKLAENTRNLGSSV